MTQEDFALDPDFFLRHQPLTLYRLVRARYANLSGVGAAAAPGRWNRRGEEAIYTSSEMGVPLLERLVHTPKDLIPSNLALMKISVSGEWEPHRNAVRNVLVDRRTNGHIWLYKTLAEAKFAFQTTPLMFAGGQSPFAVAVPSVIVPVWNIVLYPGGVAFWDHVSLQSVERFGFDPRLFPEGTQIEA